MRLIRWLLTAVLLFVAAMLALALLGLLLVAFGVFRLAVLVGWLRDGRPQPVRPRSAAGADRDLPAAPADVAVRRLRSWDAAQNRAVERWYYRDGEGRWVFVKGPGSA